MRSGSLDSLNDPRSLLPHPQMSSSPPLGGQAPLPVPEGGAEPSGEEASPMRAAPATAIEPKPAPVPAATAATGSPLTLAGVHVHTRASASSPLPGAGDRSGGAPLVEAPRRDSTGAEGVVLTPAQKIEAERRVPGHTTSGVPLAKASADWHDSANLVTSRGPATGPGPEIAQIAEARQRQSRVCVLSRNINNRLVSLCGLQGVLIALPACGVLIVEGQSRAPARSA